MLAQTSPPRAVTAKGIMPPGAAARTQAGNERRNRKDERRMIRSNLHCNPRRQIGTDDIAFYRESGYLVVEDVLDAAQLQRLRGAVAEMLTGASGITGNTDLYDLEDSHAPAAPRVRRLKLPHRHHPAFAELVRSEPILELLRPLLGKSVRLQTSKLNLKSAGYGAPVEWHQDWAYYPCTNQDVLALGVLLDDFTEDNGAMMVVPGSHTGPIHDHHTDGRFCGAMDPEATGYDFSRAVKLLAPAGSVTLHHARTIHGSAPNLSGASRNFLLYECMAADAWPLAGTFSPFTDLEEFDSRMLCGEPTLQPRLESVPVRMPLPKPLDPSSLYQAQKGLGNRYFNTIEA
jgi:ectoine hydroxylase-related dioxygenase (phytanoyl-CoA dioxygenase family)